MKNIFIFSLLTLVVCAVSLLAAPATKLAVDYVNPFIGTDAHGHTYPGATVPFGMVQLGPDAGKTGWDWCSSYHYSDSALAGFSHTHLSGTGCADLGDFLVTPTIAGKNFDLNYRSPVSHAQEHAEPGYYNVMLLDHNIKAELTATEHCGFHRYTFPASESAGIIFDLGHGNDDTPMDTYLEVKNDTMIAGYRYSSGWARDQKLFFVAKFSKPFFSFSCGNGDSLVKRKKASQGKYVRGIFNYKTAKDEAILLKVGISSVSIDGAINNLNAEIQDWNFDKIRLNARDLWQKELSKFSVKTKEAGKKVIFYTALYHCMLAPTLYSDVDGKYRGADDIVHEASNFKNYSTFSLWDTFRGEHPLFTIMEPDRVNDMVNAMLAFYKESGLLPVWPLQNNETNCMIGYHSVPVIVEAYQKGIRGFDANFALEAMKKSAFQDQRGLKYYNASAPVSFAEKEKEFQTRFKSAGAPQINSALFADSACIVSGFAKSLAGETINYRSSHSQANDALLTRALDGKMTISWLTENTPANYDQKYVTFVWLAGMASEKGGHTFSVKINGTPYFIFTTAKDPTQTSFLQKGKDEAMLAFQASRIDQHHDLFGNMYLRVPRALCAPGQNCHIEITGENSNSWDWYMTFRYALSPKIILGGEYGLVQEEDKQYQYIRTEIEHFGPPTKASIYTKDGKLIDTQLELGSNTVYLPVIAIASQQKVTVNVEVSGKIAKAEDILLDPIHTYGYVPADKERESASKTLEYAYDDWCIAQFAKSLGKTSDYDLFMKRATYYQNLYDSTTGFMRGKNINGSWVSPFDPRYSTLKQPEYTEGNAWQYTWFVPHDVQGLINLMGGKQKFVVKLDSLFYQSSDLEGTGATADVSGLIGLYAHGNEPSHHIAYLYNYAGMPWKTQELVSQIVNTLYKPTNDGLCGNEDCGQMSAWYVLSALGFYPVNPAAGIYDIGTPQFEKAIFNGFTVAAKNLSDKNKYIQSAVLNGKPLTRSYITHQEILNGGNLEFIMGEKPNKNLWTTVASFAPSMTKAEK